MKISLENFEKFLIKIINKYFSKINKISRRKYRKIKEIIGEKKFKIFCENILKFLVIIE